MNWAKRIFVVEDDQQIVGLLRIRLEVAGYHVNFAYDGLTAIHGIIRERPNLVILDVGLPHADGFEVLRELRKRSELSHIPVLMLTARHSSADVHKAIIAGAQDFITKPFDHQQLLMRVAKLLSTSVKDDLADSMWAI